MVELDKTAREHLVADAAALHTALGRLLEADDAAHSRADRSARPSRHSTTGYPLLMHQPPIVLYLGLAGRRPQVDPGPVDFFAHQFDQVVLPRLPHHGAIGPERALQSHVLS